jgi:hypothetical protein
MPQKHAWTNQACFAPIAVNINDKDLEKAWALVIGDCNLLIAVTMGLANMISITCMAKITPHHEIGIPNTPTYLTSISHPSTPASAQAQTGICTTEMKAQESSSSFGAPMVQWGHRQRIPSARKHTYDQDPQLLIQDGPDHMLL